MLKIRRAVIIAAQTLWRKITCCAAVKEFPFSRLCYVKLIVIECTKYAESSTNLAGITLLQSSFTVLIYKKYALLS